MRFFDTLAGKKRDFQPLEGNRVRMYTCGPTVYDFAHIGNFRAYTFEDALRRWLKYRGYEVFQVMNLTDVDDKTIAGANERGVPLNDYTQGYIDAFFEDLDTLNIERAEIYPRATEHVADMILLIRTLLERGHAYRVNGSVYFSIATFPKYGALSKMSVDEVLAGARVEVDEYAKADARDFALWKAAKPGEPAWDSPFGRGRLGWHIECSAMSMKYLGETFDIHTGGVDNIFPHHENEIAQSECATGKPFVAYWLHCEHLLVSGEKMSKSKGNFFTLRDLIARGHHPLAIRLFLLSGHYRHPLNLTEEALRHYQNALQRLHDFRHRLERESGASRTHPDVLDLLERIPREFQEAGDDDLNVPKAIGVVFEMIKEMNAALDDGLVAKAEIERARQLLLDFDRVLGVLSPKQAPLEEHLLALIQQREEARQRKDFAVADRLRAELLRAGILVEDTPHGPHWKRLAGH